MDKTLTLDDLKPEQAESWPWLAARTEAYVPAPIGWGKTVVTLLAIQKIREMYGPWRTLVVSTKRIVDQTWPNEIRDWEPLHGLSYASATGRDREAVLSRPDVLGLNFENLEWFYDLIDADPTLLPEILVLDEAHAMKSVSANRVKRHCGLRGRQAGQRTPGYVHRFKRRFALSGTPNPEGYADLWAQESCISMRRRLGPNVTMFRAQFCASQWNGVRMTYTVPEHSRREIERRLRPITMRINPGRYLDTLPPVHSVRWVPWAPEAWDEYQEFEANFVLDLRQKLKIVDGVDLTLDELAQRAIEQSIAPNQGVLFGKLRQLGSGFVYDREQNARRMSDASAKLDALRGIREEMGGTPMLVFTQYEAEDRMIAEAFPDATIGLPSDLTDWNARRIPMLVLNPQSAGEGLNLQHGTHTCVFYSLPWSYRYFAQAWGRIDRRGQDAQCSIIRLMRPGSIDEYVWDKILSKGGGVEDFIQNMGVY